MSCGKRDWTPTELIAFEEEITDLFLAKSIHCPIHLSRGNEESLIKIFQRVKPEDWVLSTHRSHYHALLHGIHPDWLRAEILAGRSMHIMNSEHRFFSSSIVAGIAPIAVGIGLGLYRHASQVRVWCFVGDMAAESGIFHEAVKYATRHGLDTITWVVEDNGLSTTTPTQLVWGRRRKAQPDLIRYSYERGCEHVGVGAFVHF